MKGLAVLGQQIFRNFTSKHEYPSLVTPEIPLHD
jgi:hypothetical protein